MFVLFYRPWNVKDLDGQRIIVRFMLKVLAIFKSPPASMAMLLSSVATFWNAILRMGEHPLFTLSLSL